MAGDCSTVSRFVVAQPAPSKTITAASASKAFIGLLLSGVLLLRNWPAAKEAPPSPDA